MVTYESPLYVHVSNETSPIRPKIFVNESIECKWCNRWFENQFYYTVYYRDPLAKYIVGLGACASICISILYDNMISSIIL